MKIYDVTKTAFEANRPYFVYVKGRGWTDGYYSNLEPKGWCHKWAMELFTFENRGVTHFIEQPQA